MATEPLACPYCNAYVTVPDGTVPGQRVPCPRCGEAFSYRPRDGNGADLPSAFGTSTPTGTTLTTSRRRSNRVVAAVVLGIMVLMAVIGLVWALRTVDDRRGRDHKEPLGYLPRDIDVAARVHVTEAMKDPAGREFLRQFGLGPGGGGSLIDLERWTGLKAEEIEQVAVGLRVKDNLIPRLTLVVETRDQYNLEDLLKALAAKRPVERSGKTLHPFQLGNFPAELWCPTDRLLVIGLEGKDLDAVPLTPEPGINHLPAPIQEVFRARMGTGAHAILAADTDQWETRAVLLWSALRPILSKQENKVWSQVQVIGLWLRFDQVIRLSSAFRCRDEKSAQALRDVLVRMEPGGPEGMEIGIQEGVWVTVETETSGEAVRQALRRAFEDFPGGRGK